MSTPKVKGCFKAAMGISAKDAKRISDMADAYSTGDTHADYVSAIGDLIAEVKSHRDLIHSAVKLSETQKAQSNEKAAETIETKTEQPTAEVAPPVDAAAPTTTPSALESNPGEIPVNTRMDSGNPPVNPPDSAVKPPDSESKPPIKTPVSTDKAKKSKPKAIQKRDEAIAAREAYFTPGHIVEGYGGHDEVLAYNKGENGSWSVKVQHVKKVDGQWVRQGKPQDARMHSTHPDERSLKSGPVDKLGHQPAAEVKYSEPRADRKPFPNAVDRGVKPVAEPVSTVISPEENALLEKRASAIDVTVDAMPDDKVRELHAALELKGGKHSIEAMRDAIKGQHPDDTENAIKGMEATKDGAPTISSNEVDADKTDPHAFRLAVEKISRERYASKDPVPVEVGATGDTVYVSWASAKHILRDGTPDWKTSLAVLHMEDLMRGAHARGEFQDDYKGRKDPSGVYVYKTDAKIDGVDHTVEITVRQHSDGKRYYDHIVVENKTPAGLPESGKDSKAESGAPTPPYAGAGESVPEPAPASKLDAAIPSFKYAPASSIDTPAQGVLNNANERKTAAFQKLKALRQQVKSGRDDLKVELIKADSAHKQAVSDVESAKNQIETDANKQGLTTIKPEPPVFSRSSDAVLSRSKTNIAELSAFLNGEPISVFDGAGVPKVYPLLRAWATKLFEAVGGKSVNPILGEVTLDARAVKDSMGHGMNPFKAAAFEAVPSVIEKGALIASGRKGNVDSFYVSAPVRIKGVDDIVTVLIRRDVNSQRMYLHSVTTKENLLKARDSGADAKASERSGEVTSGDVASLLHNILSFKPSLSRNAETGNGITAKETQSIVDAIKARWANSPDVVVAQSMDDAAIPAAVRDHDQKQRSLGATGSPEGFVYGGKVYLIADQLATPTDVMRVLFHEALGHMGLRGTFGDALNPILKQIAGLRRPEVAAKAKQYGLDMAKESDRLQAAEEVLAEMAQAKPELGFVKRTIAAIRAFLRKHVPGFANMKLTDAEIVQQYITPARGWIERGKGAAGGNVALSRSIYSDEPATVKQIGDHWVVIRKLKTGGEAHEHYARSEQQAQSFIDEQRARSRLNANQASGKFANWWVESQEERIRPESVRRNDAVSKSAAINETLKARKDSIKSRQEGLSLEQIPERAGFCFKCAAEASANGIGDMVIGAASDGTQPVWHAVVMRDGMVYDPTFGKWFEPGVYEALGFKPVLTLTTEQVGNYLEKTGGMVPDARNQGLGDAPNSGAPMFSRSTVSAFTQHATDKLNEHFSHPGKLSWWDKSVGSMYHLSERSPEFKRVFNSAQGFINDVSFFAAEAANNAPKLLPKLETWKDLLKKPVASADNKAIAAPIFQGTLEWTRDEKGNAVRLEDKEAEYANLEDGEKAQMLLRKRVVTADQLKRWLASPLNIYSGAVRNKFEQTFLKPGVVFNDSELKDHFNLTPAQIALYKEFRKTVGASLDNLAKADMLRYGGKDAKDLSKMIMDAPTAEDAGKLLNEHFTMLADGDAERRDSLRDTANGMLDRAEKITKLKDEGYAPLSRFGRYSVDVVVDGQRKYFSLFETAAAANQMAVKMGAEFGKANVSQGTMSQRDFEMFQGITPESLELFGNMLGLDESGDNPQDKVFQEYLKLTKNNRSAMKRLIHRKGIAGYSEDVGRVLAAFVYSNARQTAAGLHMGELGEAVTAIPKSQGELKDVAVGLAKYIKEPTEEAQALRGMMFAQYLGGSVASAFVNFTQPLAISIPYLSQFGGAKKAAAAWVQAAKDMATGAKLGIALENALKTAEEQGVVSPQEVHQLQAQARGTATLHGGDGTKVGDATASLKNSFTRMALGWGKLFGVAEQINRRSTFIAAFRLAQDQKIANPAEFATKAVNETQFINNKANKAQWSRGAIGATAMTFKSYSLNWLELFHRLATQGGPEGKKAAALMAGMLMLMAGAGGLPFEDDLEDVADFVAQRLGYNWSSKKAKQQFLEELFGRAGAQFVDKGLTGLPGSPIDVSGRLSMGNLIPGTGLLLQKRDHTGDLQELVGPVGDMAKRAFQAGDQLLSGNPVEAAFTAAPRAIANMRKGYQMADKGFYPDAKGAKVLDTTGIEAAMKTVGFQPHSVAEIQEANYLNQRAKDFYNLNAADIRGDWAKALFDKDPEEVQAVRERLAKWNEQNPDQRISANMPAILKKVREMNKDKATRIAETAPKAMRAQMKRELATMREQ